LPPVLLALITFAAEEAGHESDKTAFYVLGGLLAVFAVAIAFVGIRGHDTFPGSEGRFRAGLALVVLLVIGAMASAVLTA
jgi:hypothetical protein